MATSKTAPRGSRRLQPWTEELALRRAREQGIGELGEEHWAVIRTLREHFIEHGGLPPEHNVCYYSNLGPHCLRRLFHGSREAWRIAGLPDPGEEARTYME